MSDNNGQTILEARRAEARAKQQPQSVASLVTRLPPRGEAFDLTYTGEEAEVTRRDWETLRVKHSVRTPPQATLDELDLSNPQVRGVVQHLRGSWPQAFHENARASVLLLGPVGTGKTHIARAILWTLRYTVELDGELVATTPTGLFFTATNLMTALGPRRTDYGVEIPEVSRVVGRAPIIVVDDVGTEQTIPFVAQAEQEAERQARYFALIDYCYTARRALVVTSNLDLGGVAAHLGQRSFDRLQEMCDGRIYDLNGVPSWRRVKK